VGDPGGTLPVQPAHQLPVRAEENRWLVEALWSLEGVGLIGGEPKTNKSFLALDLAVSVASGAPCLRHFPVHHPGPVLLFAAEDALHIVRQRLEGICAAAGVDLQALDVHVITAPTVRLDVRLDCDRLKRTVEQLKPRLLILDPFVRLHRIDENISGEVAPLLAYLRELQRHHDLSVMLVHHAKKGGGRIRAGQALRGSSEFHAWGDSNLYLRRTQQQLTLTVEHRAAPSLQPIELELAQRGDALALQLHTRDEPGTAAPDSLDERIKRALAAVGRPMHPAELRESCRVRNATLHERLTSLTGCGQLLHDAEGYRLSPPDSDGYCLTPPQGP
jgi:RecA-family ATPase